MIDVDVKALFLSFNRVLTPDELAEVTRHMNDVRDAFQRLTDRLEAAEARAEKAERERDEWKAQCDAFMRVTAPPGLDPEEHQACYETISRLIARAERAEGLLKVAAERAERAEARIAELTKRSGE